MNQASKTYVSCHRGNVFLFESGGVSVYGGGWTRGSEEALVDVVIDLSDNAGSKWSVPDGWKTRDYLPLLVKLPINDFEEPLWDMAVWPALWSDLREHMTRVKHPIRVVVECTGGHGRTGTVLACLADAAGVLKPTDDPIAFVRQHYCEQAVESLAQVDYIVWATGKKTEQKPRPTSVPGGCSAGGYDDWAKTLGKGDEGSPEKKASTFLGGAVGYEDYEIYGEV